MSEQAELESTFLVKKYQGVKDRLDKVSRAFCLAKWNQVTIHLSNGTTHSCHHCRAHTIPLKELKDNPSALHNTMQKKLVRKQMLEGDRPEECNFCWRVEDLNNPTTFSDRVGKSAANWNGENTIENVSSMPWDTNIVPTYVELDFSNACNFKCMYCSPSYSTSWTKEIKEYGPYKDGAITFNSLEKTDKQIEEENNPYIEAFWKWLPDIYGKLETLRVTGGEPLLSKNTFKLFDYIAANADKVNSNFRFHINSNLGAPKQYIDKLIENYKRIENINARPEFDFIRVYTSGEGHGARGEYIRYGLNYDYWLENIDRLLTECPTLRITVMCTYNALSVTSFTEHAKALQKLIVKHTTPTRYDPINLSIPYMRHPEFLCAWILTEDYLKYMEESVEYIKNNFRTIVQDENKKWVATKPGFTENTWHDMERITEVMRNAIVNKSGMFKDVEINRRAFHNLIDEYDRRRGTSFLTTFPEMAKFYYYCKEEHP